MLILADDRHVNMKRDQGLIQQVQKLRQIVCKFWRVEVVKTKTIVAQARANSYGRDVTVDTNSVPEKALEGKALLRRPEYAVFL